MIIGLVPQPRSMPPDPFPKEDLQRAYFDVSAEYGYQQFALQPGDAGAQFINSETDGIAIQPALIQMRSPIDSTPEATRERCAAIFRLLGKRLKIDAYLQAGIKVVVHIPVTGSAKGYMADKLMRGSDRIEDLGPDFFAGGVKYRSMRTINNEALIEENLVFEPFIGDDAFLYVDYDIQRHQALRVEDLSTWLDEAFGFVRGPAMRLLEAEEV